MNILVVTKGFPHPESEDAIQKVYLLIQKLVQKNKVDLLSIQLPSFYKNYKPVHILNKDESDFRSEFKNMNIDTFYIDNPNIFFKIIIKLRKLLSYNYNWFYKNTSLCEKIANVIQKRNPDVVLAFYDSEILSSCVENLKKMNNFRIIYFTGLMNFEVEVIRMENVLRNYNNFFCKLFIFLKFKFLIFKLRYFFIQLCNVASLNIFFDTDSVVRAKKIGIKNVEYCSQYVRDFGGQDWLSKKKRSEDILFLNAALTTTNINATDNLINYVIPHLEVLKKKNDKIFNNLIVAGTKNELTERIKLLNIPWIIFPGWIDEISKIFLNVKVMIVTNDSFLGSRTKIFHALSCGLPVITHECNIRYHPNLINKENVLKANNFDHMKDLISEFLNGEINEIELSLNARKAFEQNYNKEEILNVLVSKIENI